MRLIDKYEPTTLENVIGNHEALNRIYCAVDDNDGFEGLVIMLTGQTGSGKTLIANIVAEDSGGMLYRVDCDKDADTADMIDLLKKNTAQTTLLNSNTVYIFDEADRLSSSNIARLKTAIDIIDLRRKSKLPCPVTVFFTTAKTKSQLTPTQQHHWDELYTRCIICKTELLPAEMDAYFAKLTGNEVRNISKRLQSLSWRSAWEYIETKRIPIVES